MTKTQRIAARRGVYRSSVEMPQRLWDDLQKALVVRAAKIQLTTKAEINPSFTAWLREKATEAVEIYGGKK